MKKLLGKLKERKTVKKLLTVFGTSVATVSALVVSTCAATPPSNMGDVITTSMMQGILDQVYSILPHILPIVIAIIGIRLAWGFIRGLAH